MPNYRLVVTSEAEFDLVEAFNWYEEQAAFGRVFMAAVEQQFEVIKSQPHGFLVINHGVRRAVIQRFPYVVYYSIHGDSINVLAVWHSSRNLEKLLVSRLGFLQ